MAITIDIDDLKRQVNGIKAKDDEDVTRLLDTATALITAEVVDIDDVPEAIANTAVVRVVSFLRQSTQHLGQLDAEVRAYAVSPVRASGARAMLAPYLRLL